ncbi:hypothetical protein ACHAWF_015827 [Thalassiosira exigua]
MKMENGIVLVRQESASSSGKPPRAMRRRRAALRGTAALSAVAAAASPSASALEMSVAAGTLSLARPPSWRRPSLFPRRSFLLPRRNRGRRGGGGGGGGGREGETERGGGSGGVLRATPPSAHPPFPSGRYQERHREHERRGGVPTSAEGGHGYASPGGPVRDVRYARFLALVDEGRVEGVSFDAEGTQLVGRLRPPRRRTLSFSSLFRRADPSPPLAPAGRVRVPHLPDDPSLLPTLIDRGVDVSVAPRSRGRLGPSSSSPLRRVASSLLRRVAFPLAIFAGLLFLFRRSAGGPGGTSSSALSAARMRPTYDFEPRTNVTFDDVAGCDGAKRELAEVVDFLKRPREYAANGCVVPRGVLLHGPPGTGKTLLAKAVAGEADVPFASVSGSEFVELYVGVGASRVRDLFFQAKKSAPCVVFLDEVDAVGRSRGAGYAGGNDEREQTVNQILVEMDGFDDNVGVITLAATNRLDTLDEALLRPGRFDRKVAVELPDAQGRARILSVHSRGKPLEPDVDLDAVARRTPGFSGAELENLMNEAALAAARRDKSTIGWEEVDGALDRLMVGAEKRGGTSALSRERIELVAYHEAGHAVIGALIPDYDQVQKISIVPRSNGAGGLTFFYPAEGRLESGLYSRQYLEGQLVVALGGRVAEELVFGEDRVTTGASDDLERATDLARRMVREWGMSDAVGPVALSSPDDGAPFMGRELGLRRRSNWGAKLTGLVDAEVERLVTGAHARAKAILTENADLLRHLAQTLAENEVVTAEEFQAMLLVFDAKVSEYGLMGDEGKREQLPFRDFPKNV